MFLMKNCMEIFKMKTKIIKIREAILHLIFALFVKRRSIRNMYNINN
uniref:Uncharacterized protein n=1 Tax=Meloidogyne enterolobii TaxID=390850 RepID=A0A6V7VN99_MELEN|nr:unnamed protein product [Meloidogyne enterolobii]